MKHLTLQTLFILTSFLISCSKDDPGPIEGTVITMSGFENGTFDLDSEFSYSIWVNENGDPPSSWGPSIVFIKILKKIGKPKFELFLRLTEYDNNKGFEENKAYTYSDDPESYLIFEPIFHLEGGGNFEITGPSTSANNWIEFTKVSDDKIMGTFEVNLFKNDGISNEDKIKITGSFDAGGETARH